MSFIVLYSFVYNTNIKESVFVCWQAYDHDEVT